MKPEKPKMGQGARDAAYGIDGLIGGRIKRYTTLFLDISFAFKHTDHSPKPFRPELSIQLYMHTNAMHIRDATDRVHNAYGECRIVMDTHTHTHTHTHTRMTKRSNSNNMFDEPSVLGCDADVRELDRITLPQTCLKAWRCGRTGISAATGTGPQALSRVTRSMWMTHFLRYT